MSTLDVVKALEKRAITRGGNLVVDGGSLKAIHVAKRKSNARCSVKKAFAYERSRGPASLIARELLSGPLNRPR